MNRIIEPLDKQLRQRAQSRLNNGDPGDDGYGSITHLFSYVNDLSGNVPHIDIKFFLTESDKIGKNKDVLSTHKKQES